MGKEDSTSPTVSIESVFMTAVIDVLEERKVATMDIPNALVQTKQPEFDKDGDRFIMKIKGVLIDILCEIDPSYLEGVSTEGKERVLYLKIEKAIYGMLQSALLFYQ